MFAKQMKELMDTLSCIIFPTSIKVSLQNNARITGNISFVFASHSKELMAIDCISIVNPMSQPTHPIHIRECIHVFMCLLSIKCPNIWPTMTAFIFSK